jgi:hypothetical protein
MILGTHGSVGRRLGSLMCQAPPSAEWVGLLFLPQLALLTLDVRTERQEL